MRELTGSPRRAAALAQKHARGIARLTVARAAPARHAFARAALVLWPLLLALAIAGPALGPGHLLLRDAVSTPRSFLTDAALGVSGAPPRAAPQDVLVALLSSVVDGGAVVVAVIVLALWAAGAGASAMVATLVPSAGSGPLGRMRAAAPAGRYAAATVAVWNPYVAERLLQGHWSLLAGYAALPWLVVAGVRMRRRAVAGAGGTLLALACAGLTPTGAIMGLIAASAVAALPGGWRRGGRMLIVAGSFLLVAAPWLVAAGISGGSVTSDPAGIDAFAARAETSLGTIGSLAGLGGIWNAQAVPASRAGFGAAAGTAVLLVLVACGARGVWRRRAHPVVAAVAVLAIAAVILPAVGATGPGVAIGRWAVTNVPGAGLLRDGQKWVALAMPGYTLAAALGVRAMAGVLDRVFPRFRAAPSRSPIRALFHPTRRVKQVANRKRARRSTGDGARRSTAAAGTVCTVAVIAALPSLAWGVGGALRPVHYPADWNAVAGILNGIGDGGARPSGAIVGLPAGTYRDFPWTHGPVLDPAPRYFRPDMLAPGTLVVAGKRIGGNAHAQTIQRELLEGVGPRTLAEAGVRWVLVEHRTPGDRGESADTLARMEPVYEGTDLSLYRTPGDTADRRASTSARAWAWAGHALWFAAGLGGLALLTAGRIRRRRRGKGRRGR